MCWQVDLFRVARLLSLGWSLAAAFPQQGPLEKRATGGNVMNAYVTQRFVEEHQSRLLAEAQEARLAKLARSSSSSTPSDSRPARRLAAAAGAVALALAMAASVLAGQTGGPSGTDQLGASVQHGSEECVAVTGGRLLC